MDLKIQMQIMESDSPEVISLQGKSAVFFMVLQRHLLFSLGSGLLRFSIFYSNGSVRETTLCQQNNRRGLFFSYVHVHLREPFVLVFFWNKVAISFQHR